MCIWKSIVHTQQIHLTAGIHVSKFQNVAHVRKENARIVNAKFIANNLFYMYYMSIKYIRLTKNISTNDQFTMVLKSVILFYNLIFKNQ